MKKLSPSELLQTQNWRYATKIFDATKKISSEEWKALEESLILSPSSYGLQPWKFLVVNNPEVRQKLMAVSWNQKQVVDCSQFVVFLGKTDIQKSDVEHLVDRTVEIRHVPKESLNVYRDMMVADLVNGPRHAVISAWTSRQVYIALGNFMTSAALLGVDTCPMEGIDPAKYDEILNIKGTGYATLCACAAGYRSQEDKYATLPKVRYPSNELISRV